MCGGRHSTTPPLSTAPGSLVGRGKGKRRDTGSRSPAISSEGRGTGVLFRLVMRVLRSFRIPSASLTSLESTSSAAFLAPGGRAASMTPSLYNCTTRFRARELVTCFLVLACSVAVIVLCRLGTYTVISAVKVRWWSGPTGLTCMSLGCLVV